MGEYARVCRPLAEDAVAVRLTRRSIVALIDVIGSFWWRWWWLTGGRQKNGKKEGSVSEVGDRSQVSHAPAVPLSCTLIRLTTNVPLMGQQENTSRNRALNEQSRGGRGACQGRLTPFQWKNTHQPGTV